jgi:quercetin dioxygenase-like cupin family protein
VRTPSLTVLVAMTPGVLGAQTVVPIQEEPRHRLVYETPELRVLDIEIAPGDTTLFHRHDAPISYVFISPTPTNAQVLGQSWGSATRDSRPLAGIGNVVFDETYSTAPVEHRVTNLGDVPFRLISVLNRGPGQTSTGRESLGAADPPEMGGRWFQSTHHTLENEATWEWEGLGRPVVIVQVSSGAVAVELGTGPKPDLLAPGDFIVLHPEARAQLRNVGAGPVTLAIVEVR